ncbi:hypothetical protein B0J11DRAFT_513154 [Dendryphion nanum]|uniref:Uncharacterized protein n=1 Tax=Dendryphion nanum TaxID=256645 RepID=A0A9P9CX26_9PLEO|nr:hypothetical protein B0J11DRAFT_513154 [Dendryphion nanum]
MALSHMGTANLRGAQCPCVEEAQHSLTPYLEMETARSDMIRPPWHSPKTEIIGQTTATRIRGANVHMRYVYLAPLAAHGKFDLRQVSSNRYSSGVPPPPRPDNAVRCGGGGVGGSSPDLVGEEDSSTSKLSAVGEKRQRSAVTTFRTARLIWGDSLVVAGSERTHTQAACVRLRHCMTLALCVHLIRYLKSCEGIWGRFQSREKAEGRRHGPFGPLPLGPSPRRLAQIESLCASWYSVSSRVDILLVLEANQPRFIRRTSSATSLEASKRLAIRLLDQIVSTKAYADGITKAFASAHGAREANSTEMFVFCGRAQAAWRAHGLLVSLSVAGKVGPGSRQPL